MPVDESVRLIDPELFDRRERRKQAQIAYDIEEMTKTTGWKHLEEYITNQLLAYGDKLLDEADEKKILKLQTAYRAYSDVLMQVRQFVNIGRSLEVKQDPEAQEE